MEYFSAYLPSLIISTIRYFVMAGIPFLIVYKLYNKHFVENKIQERLASNKDFLHEIKNSMIANVLMIAFVLLFTKTFLVQYTQVYMDIGSYATWYLPVSVLLALLIHDTYFYWMHRLVHTKALYKHIHLVHHKSINPSPFAAFSFHFLEAILEAGAIVVIIFLIPIHPIAILSFVLTSFAINVYGHLGFEVAPRWFRHTFLFEIFNTSVHHNMHHSKFVGNFGLYTRIWDRVMGTEYPDYVKEYDRVQARRFGAKKDKVGKAELMVNP